MTTEILLAGFGGQGVLFAGKVLAYMGLIDEKQVSWLPSYGPEMRGGTANCSVTISDEMIGSPLILEPDALIVMNAPSYEKFIGTVRPGGRAFIDSALIDATCDRTDIEAFYVPATRLAMENDLRGLANMIMLGKLMAQCKLASAETMECAVKKCVPPAKAHLVNANMKAIAMGMNA